MRDLSVARNAEDSTQAVGIQCGRRVGSSAAMAQYE
jgi:hypothetical protein